MVPAPRLLAVSDLHVGYAENRAIVEDLRPGSDGDWLIVAGDVAERIDDVVGTSRAARAVRQGRLGAGQPRAVDPREGGRGAAG